MVFLMLLQFLLLFSISLLLFFSSSSPSSYDSDEVTKSVLVCSPRHFGQSCHHGLSTRWHQPARAAYFLQMRPVFTISSDIWQQNGGRVRCQWDMQVWPRQCCIAAKTAKSLCWSPLWPAISFLLAMVWLLLFLLWASISPTSIQITIFPYHPQ